jgi:putative transposase
LKTTIPIFEHHFSLTFFILFQMPTLPPGDPYFITTTITAWIDIFTRPVYRHIMLDSIKHCQDKKGLQLYAWCLMSNHIHMIASAGGIMGMDGIMRDMKKFTSKRISEKICEGPESRSEWMLNIFKFRGSMHHKEIEYKVWKDNYHWSPLNSAEKFEQKLNYIHDNPVRAELVEEPHHYLYSSARDYAGTKGLLNVIIA